MIGNWVLLNFRRILRNVLISGERNEKQDIGNGFFLICLTLLQIYWGRRSHTSLETSRQKLSARSDSNSCLLLSALV